MPSSDRPPAPDYSAAVAYAGAAYGSGFAEGRKYVDGGRLDGSVEPQTRVLADVITERQRQNAKWGEQHHPDGTGYLALPLAALCDVIDAPCLSRHTPAHTLSALARAACQTAADRGAVTWRDILLEEVFEALAEDDPTKLRAELVQVAAVAIQHVEAIDRREAGR